MTFYSSIVAGALLERSERICLECQYHTLSVDGKCLNCKRGYWQDESIVLNCLTPENHGCRGWARKCVYYEKIV